MAPSVSRVEPYPSGASRDGCGGTAHDYRPADQVPSRSRLTPRVVRRHYRIQMLERLHRTSTYGLGMARSWGNLARRTFKESYDDDILGVAGQLSYFFFLSLFPLILVLLAFASFFPLAMLTDDIGRLLRPFVSPAVLQIIQDQMRRLGNAESTGVLSLGLLGALWSSSAALGSIVNALNRAYDIVDHRACWRVRLINMSLTFALSMFMLAAMSLIL